MGLVSILLLVIFGITAVLLVVLVLLQDEGGEGLGGIFGGGGQAQQGGRRSGNILTKATSVLGAVFLVTAFALAWLNRTPETGDVERAARQLESENGVEWWRTDDEDAADTDGTLDGGTIEPRNGEDE
ncbi:MAG: preprotein translocase subunit SecG [Spirochaetaceae bacterium]